MVFQVTLYNHSFTTHFKIRSSQRLNGEQTAQTVVKKTTADSGQKVRRFVLNAHQSIPHINLVFTRFLVQLFELRVQVQELPSDAVDASVQVTVFVVLFVKVLLVALPLFVAANHGVLSVRRQ